ncbi:MAG: 1-deoxy-D-xylulose-5-phosphate synthase, partial [Gammaproteobacteria bacterium]|nr:1-deoxy-D-xylulose-5-phosphate synthase [Gammaproteobacteria bacterium]
TKPPAPDAPATKSWTRIYTEGLHELMAEDDQVVAITAAMQSNTGLSPLAEAFPGRVLDVGIAEANGYCSAAGMAIGGLKPFVTIYSTFSQRAFDQLIHDIALQRLPVRIMMDRGGLVGADGPTHHG